MKNFSRNTVFLSVVNHMSRAPTFANHKSNNPVGLELIKHVHIAFRPSGSAIPLPIGRTTYHWNTKFYAGLKSYDVSTLGMTLNDDCVFRKRFYEIIYSFLVNPSAATTDEYLIHLRIPPAVP